MALTKVISSKCHPTVKAKHKEILASTPGRKVTHIWSFGTKPDHNNRRCVDYMIRTIADGQELFNWMWARRVRYGIRLIIWNGYIVRTYDKPGIPAGTKAKYNGPNPHRDHPHVEFNDQPIKGTSKAAKPSKPAAKPAGTLYTVTAGSGLYGRTSRGRNAAVKSKGTKLRIVRFVVPSWSRSRFGIDNKGTYYAAQYLKKA